MENSNSLTARVYQELKDEIVRFNLRPGEIIIVQHLAEKMNISRTPIREALTMLSKDNFVERASGNKFRVTDIPVSSIVELYELRKLFECYAIRETISSCSNEEIVYLEENVEAYRAALDANNHSEFFSLDFDFHQFFINKLNNKILCHFTSQLNDKQRRIRFLTTHIKNRQTSSVQEHMRILEAIKLRDSANAEHELCIHLDNVLTDISQNIDMQKNILLFSNIET